jgi:hypothetical protein
MKGRKGYRRAGIVLAFAALFVAGATVSGALGMTSVGGSSTDSTSTAADSTSSDTSSTSTDATSTSDATTSTVDQPTSTSTTTDVTPTAAAPISPTISSDKADYNPGATVLLTSHGWHAGEAVHVSVNDDVGQTWAHDVDVTADAAGDFTDQFTLPDWFVADYNVRATGASGAVATSAFSDSAVQNVTVTVSPTTAGANATYTIKFTPTNAVPVGDFIQVTFPAGTTVPASIAAGNITVNGTDSPSSSFSINTSQRQVQFDSPLALPVNVQASAVIGAATPIIGNPGAGTYTLQVKTKDDNNQATSANYAIVATKSTSTALTSSASPSTYPASVTLTATVTATPTPNPNGAGTVTFQDGATTLCNAVALSGNTATCTPSPVLGAGTHNLTADYSGAASFAPSSGSLTQSVNKGNQTITVTTHAPASAAFNSSFTVAAIGGGSGNLVTFNSVGSCSNSGATFTMTSGSGACSVKYDQAGDANYNAASQVTETVSATKANQAITVTTHAPASAVFNSSFTVAATGGGSPNPVTFTSAGGCSNLGATFTMTSGSGACPVKYDQAGDANYNAASQVTETVNATKANQAITFGALADKMYGDAAVALSASASSGLTVSFESSGPCSVIAGPKVQINGAGHCDVTAKQGGNDNWNAASDEVRGFDIAKKGLDVTADDKEITYPGDRPGFTVGYDGFVNGDDAGDLGGTLDCATTPASTAHSPGAGSYQINCSGQTSDNYAIHYHPGTLTVHKGDQTITFGALADKTYGDPDFDPGATASSGLTVTYTTGVADQCAVVNGKVRITGAGSCTVTAEQSGDSNWNPAADVSRSFNIAKASQTINLTGVPASKVYQGTFTPAATASSGLNVVITVTGVCSRDGPTGVVTMTSGTGTCTVHANQGGNENYFAAPEVNRDVDAVKADQTITFGALTNKTWGDPAFSVSASASSGLAVGFSGTTPIVCTVSGSTVTLVYVGTCSVKASQAGDSNYKAAPDVTQSFLVAYRWDGFLQPINDTAHQIGTLMSQFKLGSTVPAKFQLKKVDGTIVQATGTPTFSSSTNLGTCGTQVQSESIITDLATSGSTFRWDATAEQYIYNWSTKGLKAGKYRIYANLDDGNAKAYYVDICLQ